MTEQFPNHEDKDTLQEREDLYLQTREEIEEHPRKVEELLAVVQLDPEYETTRDYLELIRLLEGQETIKLRIIGGERQVLDQLLLGPEKRPGRVLTPSYLESTIAPYLRAIAGLQNLVDEAQGREHRRVLIVAVTESSPVSVSLEGAAEAVELVRTAVVPWRRQHAEAMARLAELDKVAEIESRKAEILEKRARAHRDRAEAERLSAEATRQREEAEKLRLENAKRRLELRREKVRLALEILAQIAPSLSEVERADYLVRILPHVEVLTSSELEVFTD